MTNIAFDTNAIIKLLNQEYDLASLGIDISEVEPLASIMVRMEVLSKRDILPDEEQILLEFLNRLTVIPINDDIEQTAIEIRRASRLKLPDCIIAATSIVLNAILLTDDRHLLDLSWPGLRTQNIY